MTTGSKIGKYTISGELGRGAMGIVYLGLDPMIERKVAVKTIRFDLTSRASEQEKVRKRFMREAQSAGSLSHPNIVTIYEVGEDKGMTYIAMQYVEGKSLDEIIASERKFSVAEVAELVAQIGDALDYAHEMGIVHRDIKPANILLDKNGKPHIVDFGIARISTSTMTQTSMTLGTPYYMSPEQISGQKVDSRTDIFSLGAVIYELLTQNKPFPGENITTVIYRIMNEQAIPVRQLRRDLSAGMDRIIQKALAKDPRERYRNCRELVVDLKQYARIESETEPQPPPRRKERIPEPSAPIRVTKQEQPRAHVERSRKSLLAVLAAMMILIVIVIGGVLIYSNRSQKSELSFGGSAGPSPAAELNARLYAAEQLWKNQKYTEALAAFHNILKDEPGNSDIKLKIAIIYQEQGEFDEAVQAFEEVIDMNPLDHRPYLFLGEIFEQINAYAEAIDYYEIYLSKAPAEVDVSAVQKRILALKSSLRPPAPPEEPERDIITAEDPSPPVIIEEARTKEDEGKQKQKAIDPESLKIEKIELKPEIEPPPQQDPSEKKPVHPARSVNVSELLAQGIDAFNRGEYSECIIKMEAVLREQPENRYAQYYLRLAKKRIEESRTPKSGGKGEIPEDTERKKEIEKEKESLRLRIQTLFAAARSDFQAGRYNRAIAQFKQVLELDKAHSDAKKYIQASHLKLAPGELEFLVKSYIQAVKTKNLSNFYKNSCTPSLYQRIRKDTDLLLNLYDDFQAVAENIQTDASALGLDHYRADVSFAHIMTGLSRAKGAREVLFEGLFIWAVEKKKGAWLITDIQYVDHSQIK